MISCDTCGFVNPLGTRWCRQCGNKLNIDATKVEAAVAATDAAEAGDRFLAGSRSAVSLGLFLLIAVLILRLALVPRLPPADVPLQLPAEVVPGLERASVPLSIDGNTAISSPRLRWRATVCRTMANNLGLDSAAMDKTLARIIAAQKADGTWAGGDPLAATALATLALQAWPTDSSLAHASRARTWLKSQLTDATRRSVLGRTLGIAALEDAEDLTSGERNRLLAYAMDGRVAKWQAWSMASVPAAERPAELGLIRDGLKDADDVWSWELQLAGGVRPEIDPKRFFAETMGTIPAEERAPWVLLAWHLVPAPGDLASVLQTWSRAEPPAASEPLTAACGPLTNDELWLMTLGTPVRLPALWSGTATQP